MMTDILMPERQEHATGLQQEIAALPPGAASHQSFIPHWRLADLQAKLAASNSHFAADARTVLEERCGDLTASEPMRLVVTNHELEVGGGAMVSEAYDGHWISTWA